MALLSQPLSLPPSLQLLCCRATVKDWLSLGGGCCPLNLLSLQLLLRPPMLLPLCRHLRACGTNARRVSIVEPAAQARKRGAAWRHVRHV